MVCMRLCSKEGGCGDVSIDWVKYMCRGSKKGWLF